MQVNGANIHVVETIPDGPPRGPTVVIVPGLGQTSTGWATVQRLLPSDVRSFTYDRLGLGRSDRAALPRPANTLAHELKDTLGACGAPPPYLLVGHSYGGIICREFLHLFDDLVAGLVYVDANQERTHDARQWPYQASSQVIKTAWTTDDASGLAQSHRCKEDEWQNIVDEEKSQPAEREKRAPEKNPNAGPGEGAEYVSSLKALGRHDQLNRQALGSRPLSVIVANLARDIQRFAAEGEAAGLGTEEDRAVVKNFLTRLPAIELELGVDVLRLSSVHRLILTSVSGHLVNLWEPELCVQEILWCLGRALP